MNSDDTNHLLKTSLDSIEQIDTIINKNLHVFNGDQELFKKKYDEQEHIIFKLKQDLNVMIKQSNDTQTTSIKTHDHLVEKKNSFFFNNIFSYLDESK
jgi:hypothetical protein